MPKTARRAALFHLGEAVTASTADQAIAQGKLAGWNIRKTPAMAMVSPTLQLPIPGRFAIIRDSPIFGGGVDVLGDVGRYYQIVQNEDLEEFLDVLVEESGAAYVRAGEMEDGRKAFVTLRLPGAVRIGKLDDVDIYLTLVTSHDGDSSTYLMVTPVRRVGLGTLNLAFQKHSNSFKVDRMNGNHADLVSQAHDAMAFAFDYMEAFQEEANRLINTRMSQASFERLIEKNLGAPKGSAANTVTRTQNKLDKMAELFAESFIREGVGETAWAALNALVEWNDHFSPVRVPAAEEDDVRSRKALFDLAFKNKALKLIIGEVA
jgi:phage/plasmid-like protein (TIGR03299 family)